MRPFSDDLGIKILNPYTHPAPAPVPIEVYGEGPCSVEGVELRGGLSMWAKCLVIHWRRMAGMDLVWECDMKLLVTVPDRDNQESLIEVATGNVVLFDETMRVPARQWLIDNIYRMLQDFAHHEVAEGFLVDGVRPHEPHSQMGP